MKREREKEREREREREGEGEGQGELSVFSSSRADLVLLFFRLCRILFRCL